MMKKGFGKGFCSGILVAALTVGLGVSAMAASRTITVDDNIRITCQPSRQGACPGSCSPRPNPFAGPARSVGSLRPRSILPNVRAAAWPVLEFAC